MFPANGEIRLKVISSTYFYELSRGVRGHKSPTPLDKSCKKWKKILDKRSLFLYIIVKNTAELVENRTLTKRRSTVEQRTFQTWDYKYPYYIKCFGDKPRRKFRMRINFDKPHDGEFIKEENGNISEVLNVVKVGKNIYEGELI